MKPRRVVLTIEVETDVPLKRLERARVLCLYADNVNPILSSVDVTQIDANVIQQKPTRRRRA